MPLLRSIFSLPLIAVAVFAGSCGTSAGELRLDSPADYRAPSSANDPARPNQPDSDTAARVDDLEATRAALDKHSGIPMSLSISGWVTQQVTSVHSSR